MHSDIIKQIFSNFRVSNVRGAEASEARIRSMGIPVDRRPGLRHPADRAAGHWRKCGRRKWDGGGGYDRQHQRDLHGAHDSCGGTATHSWRRQ